MNAPETPLNELSSTELLAMLANPDANDDDRKLINRILDARTAPLKSSAPTMVPRSGCVEDELGRGYRPGSRSAMEELHKATRERMARNWNGNVYVGGGR